MSSDNPTPSAPPTEGELINEARALIPDDLSWCPYTATGIEQLRQKAAQFGIRAWCDGRDAFKQMSVQEIMEQHAGLQRHIKSMDDCRFSNYQEIERLRAERAASDAAHAAELKTITKEWSDAFYREERRVIALDTALEDALCNCGHRISKAGALNYERLIWHNETCAYQVVVLPINRTTPSSAPADTGGGDDK